MIRIVNVFSSNLLSLKNEGRSGGLVLAVLLRRKRFELRIVAEGLRLGLASSTGKLNWKTSDGKSSLTWPIDFLSKKLALHPESPECRL